MAEKHGTPKNHLQNEESLRKSISDESFYAKIADDSIRYIQSEKRYLVLSIIFPIITMLFQITNLVLVIIGYIRLHQTSPRPRPIFDISTPIVISEP